MRSDSAQLGECQKIVLAISTVYVVRHNARSMTSFSAKRPSLSSQQNLRSRP